MFWTWVPQAFSKAEKKGSRNSWWKRQKRVTVDRGSCEKRSACGSFATMATVSLVWNRRIPLIHFHLTMVLLMQSKCMSPLRKKICADRWHTPVASLFMWKHVEHLVGSAVRVSTIYTLNIPMTTSQGSYLSPSGTSRKRSCRSMAFASFW